MTSLLRGDTGGAHRTAVLPLLGLGPLLAASTSLSNGLGLGLATLVVLVAGSVIATTLGRRLPDDVRLGVIALLIAALGLAIDRVTAAWRPGLHAELGVYLPMVAAGSILLVAGEPVATDRAARDPLARALVTGFGFLGVMLLLGVIRGTLGRGAELLLLPPGAFILLGLLLAARNVPGTPAVVAEASESPGPTS